MKKLKVIGCGVAKVKESFIPLNIGQTVDIVKYEQGGYSLVLPHGEKKYVRLLSNKLLAYLKE